MVVHDHLAEATQGRVYHPRRIQQDLFNLGLRFILIKVEKDTFIAEVEQELIRNGVDEPVLLGIIHKFLTECPELDQNIRIAGGENSQENQFIIVEIDPFQYVIVLDYPFVRSFVGNMDTLHSEVLSYTPNVSVEIAENNLNDLFSHFSRVPLLFATLRHRYGEDRVSMEVFDEVAKELGIEDI